MRKQFISMVALFMLLHSFILGAQADDKKPTVMFDQGHGQKFLVEKEGNLQLSKLSALFKEAGYTVKPSADMITDEAVKGTSVLVISGAFAPFNDVEIDAIIRFVDAGGKLCIMLHIPQPVAGLMSRLQVYASNGVILEKENLINNEPKNFLITKMDQHAITKGMQEFAVHGGWALISDSKQGKIIARTGAEAWIDLNRDGKFNNTDVQESFGVAIAGTFGRGQYVVFGDDAIFQNMFLEGGNMALGKNLVKWLQAG